MKVNSIGGKLTVPAGSYVDVLTTREWSPLEPTVLEEKSYAPGIGNISETNLAGPGGHNELVEFTREG